MEVRFWGVRGSIPTSGAATAEYGGHTSCVCIQAPGLPPLVFDMGTGARNLGKALVEDDVDKVYVLLSHTHMDHLYALPYFEPIFQPRCRVEVGVPAESDDAARNRVGQYMNGLFHPVRLDDIGGRLSFFGVPARSTFSIGGYTVETMRLVHPGGTVGFRVTAGDATVCYVTDTAPLASQGEGIMAGEDPTAMEADLVHLIRNADLLVMDATFDETEYRARLSWGHAYPEYVAEVAKLGLVKRVALFHHNPDSSDADLDDIAAKWQAHTKPEVFVAKEGLSVSLEG